MAVVVPPIVVTVTSAVPTLPGGTVAVIDVALSTVNEVTGLPPILTADAPANPLPVIVTRFPPTVGPTAGLIADTIIISEYVKRVLAALPPPGVITSTFAGPAVPAGTVARMVVALRTEKDAAATPPILTAFAFKNPLPVIVTAVPPATGPTAGLIVVTRGTAA